MNCETDPQPLGERAAGTAVQKGFVAGGALHAAADNAGGRTVRPGTHNQRGEGCQRTVALFIGPTFGWNPWLVGALTWLRGFFVVADSAQFSALVTEVAPRHAVGTALTLQTSRGFC